ncbi:MAG: hypothetical protein MZV63_19550 [Marinilabiliales bacterium]|nr:hypothetical protein [Marinilabiliales bacterium]
MPVSAPEPDAYLIRAHWQLPRFHGDLESGIRGVLPALSGGNIGPQPSNRPEGKHTVVRAKHHADIPLRAHGAGAIGPASQIDAAGGRIDFLDKVDRVALLVRPAHQHGRRPRKIVGRDG